MRSVGCALSVPRRVGMKKRRRRGTTVPRTGARRELPGLTSRSETPGHTAGFQSFFYPEPGARFTPWTRTGRLAGRGEKFLDGTLPGASGAPGWAGSWPAPARHSSPEDPSRAPRDKRKGTGAKSWQGCSSAQRVTVGLASTVLEVFRTLDSPIHVPPVYL
jgi:hypothetical protein